MKEDNSRFTQEEVKFIWETINSDTEHMPVSEAPTYRVAWWLIFNWGLFVYSEDVPPPQDPEDDGKDPCYNQGYSRGRHAWDWLEAYCSAMGWTKKEVDAFVDKICDNAPAKEAQ